MGKKQRKKPNDNQNNKSNFGPEKNDNKPQKDGNEFSEIATTKISNALSNFNALNEEERKEFGDKTFIDQFREYFKKNHPKLVEEINSKEKFMVYLEHLEDMGFSLENLNVNAKTYNEDFSGKETEREVISSSLKSMKTYCTETANKMPKDIFHDFANEMGFDEDPDIKLYKSSKIKKITDLDSLRKNFLEDKGITLKDNQITQTNKILKPGYVPTERLLITSAIKKIKKNLPNSLQEAFDEDFVLPLDIGSSIQNLLDFKRKWEIFLNSHKAEIDEKLAKKLDKIIITNGDIYKEVQLEGIDVDRNISFSEQTGDFKRIFNKLATRQLFEQNQEKNIIMEKHFANIADTFKGFPPYINELFKTYQYNDKEISKSDPNFKTSLDKQNKKILEIEEQIANGETDDKTKSELYKKLKEEKEKLESIKRSGYANHIQSINPKLGKSIQKLTESRFDISLLSIEEQQEILNTIVHNKLEDTIQNKVPDLLDIDADKYTQFMLDIFDLNKKDVVIQTSQGDLPIHFNEKSFLGGPLDHLMKITSKGDLISEIKNFPLNFNIKINELNRDFFENSVMFENLFPEFNSKNQGNIKLNDGYKVRIKGSNGKFAEGYLSQTPPKEELNSENSNVNGRFLYSKPITRPEDDREIVCRNNDKEHNNPVVIRDDQENFYDIDILSKDINLNGEGIGALVFGYILGQHSQNKKLSPENEKQLEEKFGKIDEKNIYKDTLDKNHETKDKQDTKESQEDIEKTEYEQFLESRKDLKGYQNLEKKEDFGFCEGAKIMIPMFDSDLKPSGGQFYATAEITKINKNKGSFELKFTGGGEQDLGKYEGLKKSFELNPKGLNKLTENFGYNLYRLPANAEKNQNNLIDIVKGSEITDTEDSFKNIKRNEATNSFEFISGENLGKEVKSFSYSEKLPGEKLESNINHYIQYDYKYNPGKSKPYEITMYDSTNLDGKIETAKIDMDKTNFIIFMASRKLQPQTIKQNEIGKDKKNKDGEENNEKNDNSGVDTYKGGMIKGFSINSVLGFIKGVSKKLGDSVKKYEEEQTDDLTNKIMGVGGLFEKIAGIMPTEKRRDAFSGVGEEYLAKRSNKIWEKIEKYQKYYEGDPDFGSPELRGDKIKPYLNGDKKFKDEYQAPAMLLATIEKGKGPYSRNPDWVGKGKWIKMILGTQHQSIYLQKAEAIKKDIELHHSLYGQIWADDKQDELIRLEMRYLVDAIDGREFQQNDKDILAAKYTKKFASELEGKYRKFYSQNNIKDKDEKYTSASFDFARNEYFRLLNDRPQQALGYLKTLGTKAISDTQRKVFENAVMTGMLSGLFLHTTETGTKSAIQKMCRTKGFLPGLWARNPNQQTKLAKLIDIATGGSFSKETGYKIENFSFGNYNELPNFCAWNNGFPKRLNQVNSKDKSKTNIDIISDFLKFTGKNIDGKTLIELNSEKDLPRDEKIVINEIFEKRNEKNEDPDPEIKENGTALKNGVFTKNQSIVEDLVEIQNNTFKAKDKDERTNIEDFREEVKNKLPKGGNKPESEIKFYFNVFLNRFERYGFGEGNKEEFARKLATIQKEYDSGKIESGDNILRYTIVGEILSNAGNTIPPKQLTGALETFMMFIKDNLQTILKPSIINETLGNSYIKDTNNPYEVGNWEDYVELEEIKGEAGFSPEEKEKRRKLKQQYARGSEKYINKNIYDVARKLDKGNRKVKNKFKKNFSIEEKKKSKLDTKSDLNNVLGSKSIKIKNKGLVKKIEKALLGKILDGNEDDDDYIEDDDDSDMAD